MTTIDPRLVRKGKGQPRRAVLQQARVCLELVTEHQTVLVDYGWDNADTTRLMQGIQALEKTLGGHADSSHEAENLTHDEQAALDAVKAFLRRLRLALPRVLRDNPTAGVTMNAFALDEPLRRSTPRFVAYLIKIRAAVVALDGPLQKHFGGKKASMELDTVKAALEKADTDQEAAQASGPVETQALNETVGRLLEDIEDIIRAGKSAFDGNAAMVAKFNKDLILRARRAGKNESDDAPPAAPQNP